MSNEKVTLRDLVLDKAFAYKLSVMLESRLIGYKHFYLFCDEIIDVYTKPPYWIIQLAVTKYQASAISIVNHYLYSEPFIENDPKLYDQYIACLYLRYARNELSWASFLWKSGAYSDGTGSVKEPCEYFYDLLNELEESEYSSELEKRQLCEVVEKFRSDIDAMNPIYQMFKGYYKKYVNRNLCLLPRK
ncbi:hypothetical protein RQP50_09765 [Paenibacillus sp. chi10]|uniref:Uncharacterized protein n=1 Tax=Paenibacillus suaedae TaxID=3077233 RepID=A0AAJ2JTP2_9BACL|nr:hypothetical protein [Paenibacillus sp. chi10]MDT8976526.1 hypothetical protein [Paenibacillus sp. chi10]